MRFFVRVIAAISYKPLTIISFYKLFIIVITIIIVVVNYCADIKSLTGIRTMLAVNTD